MAEIDNFRGANGVRRIVQSFYDSPLALGSRDLAEKLAAASEILSFKPGAEMISQGGADSDLFYILFGAVSVERYGRGGPIRRAGAHVGEMALIDLHQRRAATVRAKEETVVAKIRERDFSTIAAEYPDVWRMLAKEIARRLRERLEAIPQKNAHPLVFVGSSSEAKDVGEKLVEGIRGAGIETKFWTQGVFEASQTTIESLETIVRESDFAVLVLSPDDAVRSRGSAAAAPRDNVIFELGLFMGALGRNRTFALCEVSHRPKSFFRRFRKAKTLKVPTDLLGVTTLRYERVAGKEVDLANVLKELLRRLDDGPK